ncbi:MAG: hypothetical protein HZB75_01715 [Candidatus Saccharibacteria bacterium]|nr:MAG: hypothetical protein HZB75_01715 [Candidatus Saccharibacteria bacterium]
MTKKRKGKNQLITRKSVAAAVALVAAIICVAFINNAIHDSNIKAKVLKSKNESEMLFDESRGLQISALVKAGVLSSSTPDYSSKLDVCYVTHSDQGWVASNWYQDCYIRYVDLFSTLLDRRDVDEKLKKGRISGTPYDALNKKACDVVYEQGSDSSLSYLNWQVDSAQQAQYNCRVPKPTQNSFTTRGPILLDRELVTFSERSFSPEEVDKSKHYIAIESDNFYYHESLGCGMGFLCSSPRERAITGF